MPGNWPPHQLRGILYFRTKPSKRLGRKTKLFQGQTYFTDEKAIKSSKWVYTVPLNLIKSMYLDKKKSVNKNKEKKEADNSYNNKRA